MSKEYHEQFNLIDKTNFSDGPWMKEPDAVAWINYGLPCLIRRIGESGHLCGYVGVFYKHPLYKKRECVGVMEELEGSEKICVHGGLTFCSFSEKNDELHFRVDGLKVWWIGFDCHHGYDYAPIYSRNFRAIEKTYGHKLTKIEEITKYRDIEYVKNQVNNLAKQLYDLSDYKHKRKTKNHDGEE